MSEESYKKLYEAQKAEHGKTWEMLRQSELVCKNLRDELVNVQRQYQNAIDFMNGIAKNITKYTIQPTTARGEHG